MAIPVSSEGFVVVGTPIGCDSFVRSTLFVWLKEAKDRWFSRLQDFALSNWNHLQPSFQLLRFCGSFKFDHVFRVIHPRISIPVAKEFDRTIDGTILDLLHQEAYWDSSSEDTISHALQQAHLPLQNGGLGIRHRTSICVFAYFSSVLLCFDSTNIQHSPKQFYSVTSGVRHFLDSLIPQVSEKFNSVIEELIPSNLELPDSLMRNSARGARKRGIQRLFSQSIDAHNVFMFADSLAEPETPWQDHARFLDLQSKCAPLAFCAIPAAPLLTFSNNEFRAMVDIRLGLPPQPDIFCHRCPPVVIDLPGETPEDKKKRLDKFRLDQFNHHALASCRKVNKAERVQIRHDRVKMVINSFLRNKCSIDSVLEFSFKLPQPETTPSELNQHQLPQSAPIPRSSNVSARIPNVRDTQRVDMVIQHPPAALSSKPLLLDTTIIYPAKPSLKSSLWA